MENRQFKVEFECHRFWWKCPSQTLIETFLQHVLSMYKGMTDDVLFPSKDNLDFSSVSPSTAAQNFRNYKVCKDGFELMPFQKVSMIHDDEIIKYVSISF